MKQRAYITPSECTPGTQAHYPRRHTEPAEIRAQAMAIVPLIRLAWGSQRIADHCGVSRATVERWKRRDDVREALAKIGDAITEACADIEANIAKLAMVRLAELMHSDNEAIALEAINSALDRFGMARKSETASTVTAGGVVGVIAFASATEAVETARVLQARAIDGSTSVLTPQLGAPASSEAGVLPSLAPRGTVNDGG